MEVNKMGNIGAIKAFFEKNGGKKVELDEFKALSAQDREELGKDCLVALGRE